MYSQHGIYDRGIGYMPPLDDLRVEALPAPPPRAPRLDISEEPLGALDHSGTYSRYAHHIPRWRSPFGRRDYGLNTPRSNRASRRHRPVHDLTSYQPAHIIVTFESSDILRFGNVPLSTTQRLLRGAMPPLWTDGVSKDVQKQTEWIMKFRGRPWSETGVRSIPARRLICRVFKCLANQGWSYVTAVHNSRSSIRHIFGASHPDPGAHFFAISISASRRTLLAIDCGQDVAQALTRQVRNLYTPQVIRDGWRSEGVYCLEVLRRDFFSRDEDVALLLGQILKATTERGFKLDATVPLARSGLLGLGRRREVWIFRRITPAVVI